MIWNPDKNESDYINPILYTDYSDPDVIRVGSDFYMTASSFTNVPGLPVLHSTDLVHWKLISYAVSRLPDERYSKPCHGCGVWAPAIRYHNNRFYICFPMPDEGLYMVTSESACGPWSEPVQIYAGKGFIDPCPFWDDDGKAYLVNAVAKSRIGYKSVLYMSEMAPDGMSLLSDPVKIYDGSLDGNDTCEGPKLYKRNGWYYVFAPAGGVKCGWQLALRSRNIYGPYEVRKILWQGSTGVNGPHQGAWVDSVDGDWFLHFQDVFAAGRIIHLQPMSWNDDWPVIGEPKLSWKKPRFGTVPHDTIPFDISVSGWQWNANTNEAMSRSLIQKNQLTLEACPNDAACPICNYPNLVLHKWDAPSFEVTGTLHFEHLLSGETAGIISLGMEYSALEIRKRKTDFSIYAVSGTLEGNDETRTNLVSVPLSVKVLKCSITVQPANNVSATSAKPEYTNGMESRVLHPEEDVILILYTDNEAEVARKVSAAKAGKWVGNKYGFYCSSLAEKAAGTGSVTIDNITVR